MFCSHLVFGSITLDIKEPTGMRMSMRVCQSTKKMENFISIIYGSSFRRISPHFTSALHMNGIFRTILVHVVFFSNLQHISRFTIYRSLRFRLINFVSYLIFLRFFHRPIFFLPEHIIHTSHLLGQLRTSYHIWNLEP